MKEEALKLADKLGNPDLCSWQKPTKEASAMIRRLVEELDKQCKPINHYEPTAWINHIKQTGGDFYELNVSGRGEPLYRHPPQTKPLSDDEINEIAMFCSDMNEYGHSKLDEFAFAKAIEERHGIK